MSSNEVQFLLGQDWMGEDRWVVGSIKRSEDREDGTWHYCEPAITNDTLRPAWVHADNVKPYARPNFGRGRRRR